MSDNQEETISPFTKIKKTETNKTETDKKNPIIKVNRHRNNLNYPLNAPRRNKAHTKEEMISKHAERTKDLDFFDGRTVNDYKVSASFSIRVSTKILLAELCNYLGIKTTSAVAERLLLKSLIPLLEKEGIDWREVLENANLYDPRILEPYSTSADRQKES